MSEGVILGPEQIKALVEEAIGKLSISLNVEGDKYGGGSFHITATLTYDGATLASDSQFVQS